MVDCSACFRIIFPERRKKKPDAKKLEPEPPRPAKGRDDNDPGASLIRPGLFLGNLHDAKDPKVLKDNGITHVVNVTEESYAPSLDNLKILQVAIPDALSADISSHFEQVAEFVQEAIDAKGVVLVHCQFGRSRSATVVAAYLMRAESLSAAEAMTYVKSCRKIVQPHVGFQRALVEWGAKLRGSESADAQELYDLTKLVGGGGTSSRKKGKHTDRAKKEMERIRKECLQQERGQGL